MPETVLIGRGDTIGSIPRAAWEQELRSAPAHIAQRLAFMSKDHHRVRTFVVTELPRRGEPIPLDAISEALGMAEARTAALVDDLEQHLLFSTGERLDAA